MSRNDGEESVAPTPAGYRALAEGCAFVSAPASSWMRLTGEDRRRFLHGQTTCRVKNLKVGEGVYGFLVSAKGRVLADAVIVETADQLLVELPPGAAQPSAERLTRYVVADRVEISVSEPQEALLVAGPGAFEVLAEVCEIEPPDGWNRVATGDGGLEIRGELRFGIPAWRLTGEDVRLAEVRDVLRASGAVAADPAALEVVRVERGRPRAGVDYDDDHFPQETGLEPWTVSYQKGCYIGQEVVARIHYRGQVNRGLRGLRGAPGASPAPLGPLVGDKEREVGELTSAVVSPALGRPIGLAVLHRNGAELGTRLRAADGSTLEVVAPAFLPPSTIPPLADPEVEKKEG